MTVTMPQHKMTFSYRLGYARRIVMTGYIA